MLSQTQLNRPYSHPEEGARAKPPYDGEPVHLGGGDDRYVDNSGGDSVIYGGGGNDYIDAESGNDKLVGGSGDDQLYGFAGSDYLIGGDGNDFLQGGGQHDYYDGGAGRDFIDLAYSATRDDIFYRDVTDSLPGADHDTIKSFQISLGDRINLRLIDADTTTPENDRFHWIGDAAFSGTAGELRYDSDVNVSLLQGDVNGDGIADFKVHFQVVNVLHLTADEFKL